MQAPVQAPPQATQQAALDASEFQARSQFTLQNAAGVPNNRLLNPADVRMTVMKPLWLDGQLLLARRVWSGDSASVQGCWLDWEALQHQMQAIISDLLPHARLEPANAASVQQQAHMMAVLPVRLVAGQVPVAVATRTSLRVALVAVWCLLALAAAAVALLLQGVMTLSERRAAFVSAVTHELRTPLTTFRMYVEMLADGMVQDEKSRGEYLETLGREADRLTHLVENVLAYARLERGRPAARIGPVWVEVLLEPRRAESRRAARRKRVSRWPSTPRPTCSPAR